MDDMQRAERDELQRMNEALRKQQDEAIKRRDAATTAAKQAEADSKVKLASIVAEIRGAKAALEDVSRLRDEVSAEWARLNGDIQTLRDERERMAQRVVGLQTEIDRLQGERDGLRALEEHIAQLKALDAQLDAMTAEEQRSLDSLHALVAEEEHKLVGLRALVVEGETRRDAARQELDADRQALRDMRSGLLALAEVVNAKEAQIKQEHEVLEGRLVAVNKTTEEAIKARQAAQKMLIEAEGARQAVEDARAAVDGERRAVQAERASVIADRAALAESYGANAARVADIDAREEALRAQEAANKEQSEKLRVLAVELEQAKLSAKQAERDLRRQSHAN
jgi:chromosome segregation protein